MLTKQQRQALRKQAHSLKPALRLGKEGFNEHFLESLREAFHTKELLKVKILDSCPEDRRSMSEKLEALQDIELVQNIGKTFILYKEMEVEEARE